MYKRLNINKLWILPFLFGVFLAGCTEPPEPTLNGKERRLLDSIYRDSVKQLHPVFDSLCELTFDARVASAVDSLMEVRLTEIRKQMERIQRLKNPKE
ncbi:MAG: hypothetical protein D6714_20345 [Bacteroidetes bacterium]|nr:MAG: hypothetical protein D6714_20345 [Bacteroidota bacterium]